MYKLDAAGEPVLCKEVGEWGAWYETANRRVARSDVGRYWVSTVFLGLDHSFGDGPPQLFESMVFRVRRWGDLDGRRYATREEALAGHEALVEKWWCHGTWHRRKRASKWLRKQRAPMVPFPG